MLCKALESFVYVSSCSADVASGYLVKLCNPREQEQWRAKPWYLAVIKTELVCTTVEPDLLYTAAGSILNSMG